MDSNNETTHAESPKPPQMLPVSNEKRVSMMRPGIQNPDLNSILNSSPFPAEAKTPPNMQSPQTSVLVTPTSLEDGSTKLLNNPENFSAAEASAAPATLEEKTPTSPVPNSRPKHLFKSVSIASTIIRPRPKNIRPDFDAKKMWQKAKSIFQNIVHLKRIQEDIALFGTMNEPTSVAIGVKQLERKAKMLNEEIVEERFWYIIYPDSVLKKIWNVILAFLLLYTAIVMPVRLIFYEENSDLAWNIIERIIEALFMADVVVNFFSAYTDSEENLITNLKQIVLNYLKGWFALDVIACFPFELVTGSGSFFAQYNSALRLLRLPRLYKLVKVGKLFGALKVMSADGVLEFGDLFIYNASILIFIELIKVL